MSITHEQLQKAFEAFWADVYENHRYGIHEDFLPPADIADFVSCRIDEGLVPMIVFITEEQYAFIQPLGMDLSAVVQDMLTRNMREQSSPEVR